MWLLNVQSRLLEGFPDERAVRHKYAILSHTWGEEEVTFDELCQPSAVAKQGYRKIDHTCRRAQQEGLKHVWIDTCCIDKKSSAELSEAINSMFRWYCNARVCYVYLEDFPTSEPGGLSIEEKLRKCRWFTRGWTLQELIAPIHVEFLDSTWNYIGYRTELLEPLSRITGIDHEVLNDHSRLKTINVAKKMSFAADRKTTREEDRAYSLLGIFDINMPLLYGEGSKAFSRLQEEIIQQSPLVDHSILVWNPCDSYTGALLLARSPDDFKFSKDVTSWSSPLRQVFELSSQGLRIGLHGVRQREVNFHRAGLLVWLNCKKNHKRFALYLHKGSSFAESLSSLDSSIAPEDRAIYYVSPGERKRTLEEEAPWGPRSRLLLQDRSASSQAESMVITISRAYHEEAFTVGARMVRLMVKSPLTWVDDSATTTTAHKSVRVWGDAHTLLLDLDGLPAPECGSNPRYTSSCCVQAPDRKAIANINIVVQLTTMPFGWVSARNSLFDKDIYMTIIPSNGRAAESILRHGDTFLLAHFFRIDVNLTDEAGESIWAVDIVVDENPEPLPDDDW